MASARPAIAASCSVPAIPGPLIVASSSCVPRAPSPLPRLARHAGGRRAQRGLVAASSPQEEGDFALSSVDFEGQALPRDDEVLPDSLTDALRTAAEATSLAMERGCERCIVEILLPELWDPQSGPIYAEEGDQQRFWKLTRRFIDDLAAARPGARLRAVYPDAGVAAMLTNQWTDARFSISSLNDRRPVAPEDEVVVLAAPDPPGVDQAIKITANLEPGQVLVMFNPRLASGDVGVGLNMRRMRESFLKNFSTTYSLRPIGDIGSVFRRYPGMWQVFLQDEDLPGRYKLVKETTSRPGGEDLDLIIMTAMGASGQSKDGEGEGPGLVGQIGLTLNSLQRFMRSLSQ